MQLIDGLRYTGNKITAFVGAGGKTTALFLAARELSRDRIKSKFGSTVLVTTTTHFGAWQKGLADLYVQVESRADIERFHEDIGPGVVLFTGKENQQRLPGLKSDELDSLYKLAEVEHLSLLIEADGAAQRALKAPARHEPAIPAWTQMVVVMAGLSGMGKPLTSEWVHRPEVFSELSGIDPGEMITTEGLIRVLKNNDGGLKNIPTDAKKVVLLNQADSHDRQAIGKTAAQSLMNDYESIIIASLDRKDKQAAADGDKTTLTQPAIHAVYEKTAGIILAAGDSDRFGEPKQLILWKGQTFLHHVAAAAIKAGLSPIIVVVGYASEEVRKALIDLPLRIVNNPKWMDGLSTSIKTGLRALEENTGGAVFIQADQPQLAPELIRKLIESHQQSLSPIVAPIIDGMRGNPVLFDTSTYPELIQLQGESGGRVLFSRHPVQWVTWHDAGQLLDVDTPDDYKRFLEVYPGGEEKT